MRTRYHRKAVGGYDGLVYTCTRNGSATDVPEKVILAELYRKAFVVVAEEDVLQRTAW
jgi:hypothetical protein